MLSLETTTTPRSRPSLLKDAKPGWFEVFIGGSPDDLTALRKAIVNIQVDSQPTTVVAQCSNGIDAVHLFRTLSGLHVLPLMRGLAICADDAGFEELADGLRICLENAATPAPIKGFHRHIELIDEYALKPAPIGTLTLHVTEPS